MKLEKLPWKLTVCKVPDVSSIDCGKSFYFIGKTDEEISLVCLTEDTPRKTTAREDGWKGFRVRGPLDFSLVGILAELSDLLARNGISIFAVSTFNTDYILVKEEHFEDAVNIFEAAGLAVA